jgi:tRNA threonylcarbamoyladenosine biosynthesis protein TsaE
VHLAVNAPSVDETRRLAGAVARLAREGDVVLLVGEMGAGKTAFAQGFAAGLGVAERVTSPTFTLVNDYSARLRMHHVDVYRLDHLQEVLDLGLAELLDDGGVTLIEWGDVVVPTLPRDFLEVHLEFAHGNDDARRITLREVGPSWQPRLDKLTEAVSYWLDQ